MRLSYTTNRPEMVERLRNGDLDGYYREEREFGRLTDGFATLAYALADELGCVRVNTDPDVEYPHWWYLHRCPLGCLQLTTFDDDGPVGDLKIYTSDDLAQWARWEVSTLFEVVTD